MIQYIQSAGICGIKFRAGSDLAVRLWVDAAYGVHEDGKSHTGTDVTIGFLGPVFAKSAKQKSVTKSSTEAELVGVSDRANQASRYAIL